MKLRREYRHRDETQVAILESLVDRLDEGMTVFELRSRVGVDIDELEQALSALQADGLISATDTGERTILTIDESVLTEEETGNGEQDFIEWVSDRFGL